MITNSYSKKISGDVKIFVEEDERTELVWHDQNLIVDTSRISLAHLLAEADSNYKMGLLKIGLRGHSGSDILTPVDPLIGDTDLYEEAYQQALDPVFTYLPVGVETSVKFVTTISKLDANGTGVETYTEAGLFSNSGLIMFARETFPGIVKNVSRRLIFEWTIVF